MLIRNAALRGYPGLTDLRLMHGRVQEIGSGLHKGLYESELDLAGDELLPCPPEHPLLRSRRRPVRSRTAPDPHILPGSEGPFLRRRDGLDLALIDQHSAD